MRVYHGTNERFNKFSLDKIGSNTNVTKAGFFFTDSIETAKSYGDTVLVCDIEMNSPILCDFNGGSTYYFGEEKWYTPNGLAERIAALNDAIKNYGYAIGDMEREEAEDYMDYLGEQAGNGYHHLYDDYIDGIICKDVKDNMGLEGKPCTNYIVFKPEQIKVLKELKEDWIDDIDWGADLTLDDLDLSVSEPEPEPVKVDSTEHYVVLNKKIINDNFARWFGNSYCCNSKNEPIVVYHSTNAEFDTFKKGLDGTANGRPVYGGGFCFSAFEDYTKDFGKNTMPCVLSIQNPLILKHNPKLNLMTTYKLMYKDNWKKYYDDPDHVARGYLEDKCENIVSCFQMLNSKGYSFEEIMDAYHYDGIIDGHVFIVVRPNQIKSINNKGTWSKNSDNIYESLNRELERYL